MHTSHTLFDVHTCIHTYSQQHGLNAFIGLDIPEIPAESAFDSEVPTQIPLIQCEPRHAKSGGGGGGEGGPRRSEDHQRIATQMKDLGIVPCVCVCLCVCVCVRVREREMMCVCV